MIGSEGVHTEEAKLDMWNVIFHERVGRIVTVTPEMTNDDDWYAECLLYIPTLSYPKMQIGNYVIKCLFEIEDRQVVTRRLHVTNS